MDRGYFMSGSRQGQVWNQRLNTLCRLGIPWCSLWALWAVLRPCVVMCAPLGRWGR